MGKDVVIFIKGTRSIDGESDTVEMMTKGRYYKKRNARYLSYEEMDEEDTAPTSLDAIRCIGNSMPTYSGSFGTSVTWREFDLSLLFTYQGNYKMRNTNMPFLNYGYTASWDYVSKFSGLGAGIANRWQNPGDEARTDVPRACFTEAGLSRIFLSTW